VPVEQPRKKAYLVREAFEWDYGDQPPAVKLPAVWAFPTREQALARRDELERSCRHVNPFAARAGSLEAVTSLGEGPFREHVRSLGLEPPEGGDWWWWWGRTLERVSQQQLAGLWAALDRAQVYQLGEAEACAEPEPEEEAPPAPAAAPGRKVYVVQRLSWQDNDNWHDVGDDEPVRAFTDPELAEVYRRELEEPARQWRGNPCRLAGGLWHCTSLSEAELLARLGELGVEPPPADAGGGPPPYDFGDHEWWDNLWESRPSVWHQVWDLFDRARFYEVVEVDLGR
jgi:hypothetical protein